jgi:hypothetical protein
MKKKPFCRDFVGSTLVSTPVEDAMSVPGGDNAETHGAAISRSSLVITTVENFCSGGSSILPAPAAEAASREQKTT